MNRRGTTVRGLAPAALVAVALGLLPGISTLASQAQAPNQESDFLSRIRRLTVEGRRAGEGYWSPDGKRLVFQSEREPGNPFYQIYVARSRDRRHQAHLSRHRQDDVRVLPSRRAATRSSSPRRTPIRSRSSSRTKSSPSARRARNAATRGTTTPRWTSTRTTRRPARLQRLTTARGYDAEGSYSPDGQWIVFTSMRDAYNRPLNAEGKEAARGESELLRRDLHHARRRLGAEAADERSRLRRRTLLHARRHRASSGAASTSRA